MTAEPTKVSRVEFYQALSLIWLFISFAIGTRLSAEHRLGVAMFFLLSLMMAIVYAVMTLKLRRNQHREPAAA